MRVGLTGGVGSGKSTVAALVAQRLGCAFIDGDAFHTPEHIAKMHAGHALDDADRALYAAKGGGRNRVVPCRGSGGVAIAS